MSASVGKSGARMCSIKAAVVALGSSNRRMQALATSLKLCGSTSVAMPTAMPVLPFKSTIGRRAGNTAGSLSVPSKFGAKSTVPWPSSASSSSAWRMSRASV